MTRHRKADRPRVGSPFPIDHGASTRVLWRREYYGGTKGRRARERLRALEKRIARTGVVQAMLAGDQAYVRELLLGIRSTLRGAIDAAAATFQDVFA